MDWTRVSKYCERSDAGYHVAAVNGADGWQFAAWSPDRYPDVPWYEWPPPALQPEGTVYARGAGLPARYSLLGYRATAAAARALCEAHTAAHAPSP